MIKISIVFISILVYSASNGSYYSCNTTSNPYIINVTTTSNIETKDSFGYITSPNYPETYTNNASCWWDIVVDDGFIIHLTFVEFEIEEG